MAGDASMQRVLEALDLPAALSDRRGSVVAYNNAWQAAREIGASDDLHAFAKRWLTAPEVQELSAWLAADAADAFDAEYAVEGGGRTRWLAFRVAPMTGEPPLCLVTLRNVTARRHITADLHRSRTRLRAVVTGAPIWLFSLDLEGRFTLAEGLGAEVFGAGSDLIGEKVNDSFSHVPGMIAAVDAAQRGETTTEKVNVGRMVFLVRCAPSFGPDGEAEGVVGVATDVTEQTRLERLKDELVSIVSHELRTPLTAIHGSLRLMEGGLAGALPDDAKELVSVAGRNTQRLIRLVNDMLDLDKIEAGHLELQLDEWALDELVLRAVESLEVMATEADLRIHKRLTQNLTAVVDADRIVQVVINLLSNAIKHSPPGGRVEVVTSAPEAGQVRIEVRDEGPGIPDAQQLRIFGRFEQLGEATSRPEGTGLGLAISKSLVEAHGGEIGVKSKVGAGSTFHVQLPARLRARDEPGHVRKDSAKSLELTSSLVPRPSDELVEAVMRDMLELRAAGPQALASDAALDLNARCRIAASVAADRGPRAEAFERAARALEKLAQGPDEAAWSELSKAASQLERAD